MAKLYTKTGDRGQTGLVGGSRVPKNHLRVKAYGAADEVNVALGLCRAVCNLPDVSPRLEQIQQDLFVLGGDLAAPNQNDPDTCRVTSAMCSRLEEWIDLASELTPALTAFVLPAGCELACRFHQARTICRRAERETVALAQAEEIGEEAVVYLNRLSDLLFAWARQANHLSKATETVWTPPA